MVPRSPCSVNATVPLPPASARSVLRATTALRVTPDAEPERVLILDDEEVIRLAVHRYLRGRGYEVVIADSAQSALEMLAREKFDLMVCDIRMPGFSGLDLLPQALRVDPDLGVIMLSAVNDAQTATDALAQGAMDYLVKPIEMPDLLGAIERAAHRRRVEIERRHVEWKVRQEVAQRTAELEQEKRALHELTVGIAETLINAMEAKDVYLRGHSRRVAEQAATIAEELGLDADIVENVRLAGRLHDVGKIGIREEVLNKPGRLTPEEYEHVKDHVRIGMEILAPLKHIPIALEYVHDHHEHWNGGGYPRGLAGEQITIGGRILAACDAYDALTSRRAFREAMEPRATIDYLAGQAGTMLDATVYAALRTVVLRRRTLMFIDDLHA